MSVHLDVIDIHMPFFERRLLRRVVKKALEVCDFDQPAHVNIALCSNDYIRQINTEHRDRDYATDVLSFPMIEWEKPFAKIFKSMEMDMNWDTGKIELGDIIISYEKAKEQAAEYGHGLRRELAYLCVHGMMHLLGYDHMQENDKTLMREREEEVMKHLNIMR